MADDKKTDAVATVPAGMQGMISQARPEGADTGTLGNEGIGRGDIAIPRLGLAQKMSPEIDPTNAGRYIEGLQFTDLFHSATRAKMGKGPVYFSIIKREDPRWIEFIPIAEGGGIKDMNVRANDPRTKFTNDAAGKRIKPVATMFYDFLVLLLNETTLSKPLDNIIALSLKSSAIKAAKNLNLLVTQRGPKKIFKGAYQVTTGSETDKKSGGVYAVYKFDNAGWLEPGSPVEKLAEEMFEAWKTVEMKVDRDEDPDDFDPAAYEAANQGGARPDPQM